MSVAAQPLIWFVKGWRRFISPLYGDVCKYHPSCSAYGLCALQTHGAVKGSWLTVRRILRCNPWSAGGFDFVPGSAEQREWAGKNSDKQPSGETRHEAEVA